MKTAAVAVAVLLLAGVTACQPVADQGGGHAGGSPSASRPNSTVHACRNVPSRHLEVCTAYIANASLAARYPYYKFGRSTNHTVASAALDRLGSRYTGVAYRSLVRQTAGWPASVHASLPDIHIDSVTVAADDSSAVLHTRETWHVAANGGQVLFAENNQSHTITMRRVPGVVLHKWVVADIR